jgi:hypothetical protein
MWGICEGGGMMNDIHYTIAGQATTLSDVGLLRSPSANKRLEEGGEQNIREYPDSRCQKMQGIIQKGMNGM